MNGNISNKSDKYINIPTDTFKLNIQTTDLPTLELSQAKEELLC